MFFVADISHSPSQVLTCEILAVVLPIVFLAFLVWHNWRVFKRLYESYKKQGLVAQFLIGMFLFGMSAYAVTKLGLNALVGDGTGLVSSSESSFQASPVSSETSAETRSTGTDGLSSRVISQPIITRYVHTPTNEHFEYCWSPALVPSNGTFCFYRQARLESNLWEVVCSETIPSDVTNSCRDLPVPTDAAAALSGFYAISVADDSDGDTLDSFVERNNHKTDPTCADTDGDGFRDDIELLLGSDPTVSSTIVATNSSGTVATRFLPPFSTSAEALVGVDVYSNAFEIARRTSWRQIFVSSLASDAAGWDFRGLSLSWTADGSLAGSVPSFNHGSYRIPLGTNEVSRLTLLARVEDVPVAALQELHLLVYEPRVSLPGCASERRADGTVLFVTAATEGIPVAVDRSARPSYAPLSDEERLADPFEGIPGHDYSPDRACVSLSVPGEYPLPHGDSLLVISPDLAYGSAHAYSGDSLVPETDGMGNVTGAAVRYAYPLDTPALWEAWHEGTNLVSGSACSCVPSFDPGYDGSVHTNLGSRLVRDGDSAVGVVTLGSAVVWSNRVQHVRKARFGGRSDLLSVDGCACDEGCESGDCDLLSGPSLGSVRFRIALGKPDRDHVDGFLYFNREEVFTPTVGDFRLLVRSDADVIEEFPDASSRRVTDLGRNGLSVLVTNVPGGVGVSVDVASTGEHDRGWEVFREGEALRFRKYSAGGNLMSDTTYSREPDGRWRTTDNLTGLGTVRLSSGGRLSAGSESGLWQETLRVDGCVTGSYVRVRSELVGNGEGLVSRETERWEMSSSGEWLVSRASYWDDVRHPRRHGALRLECGDDRAWSYHAYDESGREVFRAEQLDGSPVVEDGEYGFEDFPRNVDAVLSVYGYAPLEGDSADPNDEDMVRTETRYAVCGGETVLTGRTWTRYVRAFADGLPVVVETTVRAGAQDAAPDDPRNAVSVRTFLSSDSPEVPCLLRGETVSMTDEDGVTTLFGRTCGESVRTVTRRLKDGVEDGVRQVSECDPNYGRTLCEATQLTCAPSVEFGWRRHAYDRRGRLRSTAYDDGSTETNDYSCCRLLSRTDRTGAKVLMSTTTGYESVYRAEEEISMAGYERGDLIPSGWGLTGRFQSSFRVTQRYSDPFGRETNVTVRADRTPGASAVPGSGYSYGNRSVTTTSYPSGFSDFSVSTDGKGLVTETLTLDSPAAAVSVTREFAPGIEGSEVVVSNIMVRGGRSEMVRVSCGKCVRSVSEAFFSSDGCRHEVSFSESSDCGVVTNSTVRFDFLGRPVVTTTPVSCVSNVYDGTTSRVLWSADSVSGLVVTNLFDAMGREVGSVSCGVTRRADECYEFLSNVWWRVESSSVSAAGTTNASSRTLARLTGLSDGLREETLEYSNGSLVSRSVSSVSGTDVIETVESPTEGVKVSRCRYGREIEKQTPGGTVVTYRDPFGRPYLLKRSTGPGAPLRRWRFFLYGDGGELASEGEYTTDVGTSSETFWKWRGYGYDARGNRIATTNELGEAVERACDAEGRPVQESGDTYPVRHGYDSSGRRTWLGTTRDGVRWDPTGWQYDPATGVCLSKTYADGATVRHTYTADGLPLRTTEASGAWRELEYDSSRRLSGVLSSDGAQDAVIVRDDFGQVVLESNAVSRVAYSLDRLGLATNEVQTVDGVGVVLRRTFDAFGRLLSFGRAGGLVSEFVYTNGTRLATLSDDVALVSYSYDPDLSATGYSLVLSNGVPFARRLVRRTHQRDQIEEVRNSCRGVTNVMAYCYDLLGRPVTRDSDSFAYNNRGEVVSATISGLGETHSYNDIGTHIVATEPSASTSYESNARNQYASIVRTAADAQEGESVEVAYDADGSMTAFGPWTYAYDSGRRLTSVASNGVTVATMAYDAQGRRVKKVAADGTHRYFYDDWLLVYEHVTHADSSVDEIDYIWGMDISGRRNGAAGIGGLLYLKRNGAIYVPFYDAYGNILGYRDANGNLVAHYTYNAFGKTIAQEGSMADTLAFRYSTKYCDAKSDLYYYGLRCYCPEIMMWVSLDPVGEKGGVNLLAFCANQGCYNYDLLGQTKYWDNYMRFGTFSSEQTWRQVGGNLYWLHLTDDDYYNSCAIRVSRSIVNAGESVKAGPGRWAAKDFVATKDVVSADGISYSKGHVFKAERPKARYVTAARRVPEYLDEVFTGEKLIAKKSFKTVDSAIEYAREIQKCNGEAYFAGSSTSGWWHSGMVKKGYDDPHLITRKEMNKVTFWRIK